LDIIKLALSQIEIDKKVVILTVGTVGLLYDIEKKYSIKEFGWLSDDFKLAELYQACDLFLMPSKQETFGMMASEAMSCGKTVLSVNNDTALPDTICAPECGIAIEENDYPSELQRLINNPYELTQRGEKSLLFARDNYGKGTYVKKMIAVYEDIMKNHVTDETVKYILDQLKLHSLDNKINKAKMPAYYRYLVRPMLRALFSKHRVKYEFDQKFKR
jgi:glycosyltransferase involved in cell wall biosynthesis